MDVMDPSLVVALGKQGGAAVGREAFRAWNIHEAEAWTSETRLSYAPPISASFDVGATESNREGEDRIS